MKLDLLPASEDDDSDSGVQSLEVGRRAAPLDKQLAIRIARDDKLR